MKDDPLRGLRVLLTREREDNFLFRTALENRGAVVIEIPAVVTHPLEPAGRDEALSKWADFRWTVFTSGKAVRFFIEWTIKNGKEFPPNSRIAAVGAGTSRELSDKGFKAEIVPETEDGKSLGIALSEKCPPCLSLFPQAKGAVKSAQKILKAASWDIFELEIYETLPNRFSESDLDLLEQGADIVFFASPSALRSFKADEKAFSLLSKITILPIGMTTFREAGSLGLRALQPPKDTSFASILSELEKYCLNFAS
jgi:uroporphyrinogen III methyltransferase / synthase